MEYHMGKYINPGNRRFDMAIKSEIFIDKTEMIDSGKGYADIVFLPSPIFIDKPAMLVELKYEKDAVTALSQIKKQRYPERLRHYKGNILLVGINYEKGQSPKQEGFKHHSCVIENA